MLLKFVNAFIKITWKLLVSSISKMFNVFSFASDLFIYFWAVVNAWVWQCSRPLSAYFPTALGGFLFLTFLNELRRPLKRAAIMRLYALSFVNLYIFQFILVFSMIFGLTTPTSYQFMRNKMELLRIKEELTSSIDLNVAQGLCRFFCKKIFSKYPLIA